MSIFGHPFFDTTLCVCFGPCRFAVGGCLFAARFLVAFLPTPIHTRQSAGGLVWRLAALPASPGSGGSLFSVRCNKRAATAETNEESPVLWIDPRRDQNARETGDVAFPRPVPPFLAWHGSLRTALSPHCSIGMRERGRKTHRLTNGGQPFVRSDGVLEQKKKRAVQRSAAMEIFFPFSSPPNNIPPIGVMIG